MNKTQRPGQIPSAVPTKNPLRSTAMHLIHEDLARAQIRARVEAARCWRLAEKVKRGRRQERASSKR